ncbi:aminotransferase class V-fold PLP-dependent enzyme [Maribacter sp. 1_MG-2023]|uniref:pyridoxal phosphate-dependent decarboxylase family protein n=1 Tax=Maribacter sp. 1_MG-2023 TaxID=3062677 RepID=UPI0026E16BD7|nr:aminotransferase class V-fold PLP-dependent enzyme [Maribacter sp. 1_MG-2023]MDO6472360.1 aminotransferase class V-fold PLP-dependent enzyme [Maribacter sp. 1_MG-2023]
MKSTSKVQKQMYKEVDEKIIFEKASQFAKEYLESVFERNVYPTEQALSDLDKFDESMPQNSSKANDVLDFLNQYGSPATVTTTGARYFGFVSGGAIPVSLAAKVISTFWDQAPAMHVLSPIGSVLETVVEKWLKEILNLPESTVAGFVSGTSTANFCGLAAARFRLLSNLNWDINDKGLFNAPQLRIVTGKHAHSTILKAIGLLGFGKENIEWVDVDDQGRLELNNLPQLDERTILILQAGNVNSGSFDNFSELCKIAKKAGSWVHIDGAFGLWAGAVDKLKHLTKGIEGANSWAVDGHKTLNTPYDCGIVLCEDEAAIRSALHMTGSYIITGEKRDGMFYTPEMSRRARVIELWATMKYLGKNGIDEMIYEMHLRANQFANEIKIVDGFSVLNDVVFNQVLIQCETDALTDNVLKRVQELRECWAGGSIWKGKKVIRISICSWATTASDITRSVNSFKQALNEISK